MTGNTKYAYFVLALCFLFLYAMLIMQNEKKIVFTLKKEDGYAFIARGYEIHPAPAGFPFPTVYRNATGNETSKAGKMFGFTGQLFRLFYLDIKPPGRYCIYRYDPAFRRYFLFYENLKPGACPGPIRPVALCFDKAGANLFILDLGKNGTDMEKTGKVWRINKKNHRLLSWWSWPNELILLMAILFILGLALQLSKFDNPKKILLRRYF
ncbi:MAG: hypothetical protein ACM3WV_04605 [Bacillota bacterium]